MAAVRRARYSAAEALRIILDSDTDDSNEELENDDDYMPLPRDDASETEDHVSDDNEVSDIQSAHSDDEDDRENQQTNATAVPARGQVRGRGRGRGRGRSRGARGRGRAGQSRDVVHEAQDNQNELHGRNGKVQSIILYKYFNRYNSIVYTSEKCKLLM